MAKSVRFIPTHVGNTYDVSSSSRPSSVHPHACGEHKYCYHQIDCWFGSSPRMWGTPIERWFAHNLPRFIPTHVGNTSGLRCSQDGRSVHPHACGEHTGVDVSDLIMIGSSPRMWGTQKTGKTFVPVLRFIPTHVGNTLFCLLVLWDNTVHPHACGEHI